MAWTIEYSDTALKWLRKLDHQVARRVLDYMDNEVGPLVSTRDTGKPLSGVLGGLWRYRVGDNRVICELRDDRLPVLVVRVGNRRETYR